MLHESNPRDKKKSRAIVNISTQKPPGQYMFTQMREFSGGGGGLNRWFALGAQIRLDNRERLHGCGR
jgi:hypothetical protein